MVEILRAMIFLLEHSFFLVLPFLAHRALHPDFILFKLRSSIYEASYYIHLG
jgi:hypothetical protein